MNDIHNSGRMQHQFSGSTKGISIFSSTRWTGINQIGTQVIKFVVSVILARFLAPQDFGLMAMAIVVIGFIDIFKHLGTVAAIVQRKDITSVLLSSLFYFNILFGFVTGGCIAVGAPLAARVYGDPRLSQILQILSLTFVISSFGLVMRALLEREMRFDKLAFVELSTVLIHGTVAIVLAVWGLGVWALVGGAIVSSLASTLLLWLAVTWKPQFYFKWQHVTTVFQFSFNLTGANIVNYFMFNADRIIIGRFLGATTLGFYELAQRIFMTPVRTITHVLTRVLFPGFSRFQDDNMQIQQKYLRACGGIALISFPILAGLFILARPFILVLFGSKWSAVIPLIMILTPIGIIQSITSTVGVIYLVKGRTDWLFIWEIIAGTCLILSYICGLHWGIRGVATAYLFTMILLTFPAFAIPFRLIGLKFINLVSALKPYAFATIIMIILTNGFRLGLEHLNIEPQIVLISCIIIGAFIYTTIILFDRPQALEDFQEMLFQKVFIRKRASL